MSIKPNVLAVVSLAVFAFVVIFEVKPKASAENEVVALALGKIAVGQNENAAILQLKKLGYSFDGSLDGEVARYLNQVGKEFNIVKLRVRRGVVVGISGYWETTQVGKATIKLGQKKMVVRQALDKAHLEFNEASSTEIAIPKAATVFHFGPQNSTLDGMDFITMGVGDTPR